MAGAAVPAVAGSARAGVGGFVESAGVRRKVLGAEARGPLRFNSKLIFA